MLGCWHVRAASPRRAGESGQHGSSSGYRASPTTATFTATSIVSHADIGMAVTIGARASAVNGRSACRSRSRPTGERLTGAWRKPSPLLDGEMGLAANPRDDAFASSALTGR